MGANAIKGIITFALGGVFLVFACGLVNLFFTREPASFSQGITGLVLAVIGFLFVGVGLWGIIQDAVATKQSDKTYG